MAKLIVHIPNKSFQIIRYYEFYANKYKDKITDIYFLSLFITIFYVNVVLSWKLIIPFLISLKDLFMDFNFKVYKRDNTKED